MVPLFLCGDGKELSKLCPTWGVPTKGISGKGGTGSGRVLDGEAGLLEGAGANEPSGWDAVLVAGMSLSCCLASASLM